MKDTVAILNIAYPEVEKKLKVNLAAYKKYISKFINIRSSQLYSNMPSQQIYFTLDDAEEFFKSTGIDKTTIIKAINNTYYYPQANFNPSYAKDEITVAMLCVVRYFKIKNMKKELDLALINLAFSGKYYPSIWYRSFPTVAPQEHIMEYVVTHMVSNKFDIAREGSVIGVMKSVSNTWINTYTSRFKDFHDDDCVYLIQQLHNRIGSFMNNIAELYYQAYENKEYITYDSDDVSEDNYHLAGSDSFKLQSIIEATMSDINTHGVNQRLCKTASSNLVKTDEIKSIIEVMLSNNKNMGIIREYITLMVACYFQESTTKDVRDISFVSFSIKPKPNTKNPYVLKQNELLNIMLMNNSEHFKRRRNNDATEQAYYRSIRAYFAMQIQESNK